MSKQKMFVRSFIVSLVLVFSMGIFLSQVYAKVELKMYYPVGVAGPLAKLMNEMVGDYNKAQKEIYVEPIYAGSYREAMEKAQTAIMAGKPPAVAVLDAPVLLTLLDMDAIIPLDEYIEQEGGKTYVDTFVDAFMKIARHEGSIWSIPWQRSTPVFYYNKDSFREVGLDPNKPPETWEDVVEYAKKLTKRDASGKVVRWGVEIPINFWLLKPLILQSDGILDNESGTKVYFDTEPVREAFQFLRRLAFEEKVMPAVREWGASVSDFAAGATAMLYNSTGALTFIRKSTKYDFGTAFLPRHKKQLCIEGGGNFFIFKKTKKEKQDAAWKFIKWMTSPENAAKWSLGSGYVAVKKAAFEVPEYKEYLAKWPQAKTAYYQLEIAERNMMTHRVNELVDLVDRTIERVMGGGDLDVALKDAQAKADKILEKYQ